MGNNIRQGVYGIYVISRTDKSVFNCACWSFVDLVSLMRCLVDHKPCTHHKMFMMSDRAWEFVEDNLPNE